MDYVKELKDESIKISRVTWNAGYEEGKKAGRRELWWEIKELLQKPGEVK